MKQAPLTLMRDGASYVSNHPQLIITIILMIVIPISFLVSGQQFLNAARENQERLEMDRVGIMHDLLSAFIVGVAFNPIAIQSEVQALIKQNPDITKLHVVREEGTDLHIIAAHELALVGTLAESPDTYRISNTNPQEAIIAPYIQNGVRYWQSFKVIRMPEQPEYYIFIETSLEHIDSLFSRRIQGAYMWLIVLL